jgi:hypothetical protein
MDLRKLSFEQEVKDDIRITPIILLSVLGHSLDLGSTSDEHLVSEDLNELYESGTISADLRADDHFSYERGREAPHILFMIQL